VSLTFEIFEGVGVAAAVGIRPFLPGLAFGALAAENVTGVGLSSDLHLDQTSYHFLQDWPFLLVMLVGAVGLSLIERRMSVDDVRTPVGAGLALVSLVVAALLFAGVLARGSHPVWPGFVGGVVCAAIGIAASRPFLTRIRERLEADDARVGVPLIAEGAALVTAVLSIIVPPLGVVALLALLVLLWRGPGREEQKYAGLRILR
jgi:hypothetical protein